MAFFENLGKKISDAGQGAAQQAKNFSEVTKLNGSISEKEKKISQLYLAIGEAYFAQHKDDPAAEEAEKIEDMKTLKVEIEKCRDESNKIKGITKCPNCGAEVSIGAVFCSTCGSKMPQEKKEEEPLPEGMRRCPGCDAVVPKENLFCNQCGMKLEPEQSEEPVESTEETADEDVVESTEEAPAEETVESTEE